MTGDDQLLHFFKPARQLARVPTSSDSGAVLTFRSEEDRQVQETACQRAVNERCCAEVRLVHAVAPTSCCCFFSACKV